MIWIGATALTALLASGAWLYASAPEKGSPSMRLAKTALRIMGKPLANPDEFRRKVLARKSVEAASLPDTMRARYLVSEQTVGGRRVLTLTPKSGVSPWHVIYTHGGAYVSELVKPHWDIIDAMMAATGATVVVPFYPLAPEHDHRAAYAFLADVYRHTLKTVAPDAIVLAGDSAGGGLAIGQALAYRDAGLPLPARIIALSPWLDLALADPAIADKEQSDIMLGIAALRQCGVWWAGPDNPRAPHLSPLYAKLEGLPPIDIFQGEDDLLVIDARQFAQRLKRSGDTGRYSEYPGAFHVFMGATFTPEAQDVFTRIAATLSAVSGSGAP